MPLGQHHFIILILIISISLISEDPKRSASGSFIINIIIIIIVSLRCTLVCHSPSLMWVFGDGSLHIPYVSLCTLLPLHAFLNIFHPPTSFRPPCTQVHSKQIHPRYSSYLILLPSHFDNDTSHHPRTATSARSWSTARGGRPWHVRNAWNALRCQRKNWLPRAKVVGMMAIRMHKAWLRCRVYWGITGLPLDWI